MRWLGAALQREALVGVGGGTSRLEGAERSGGAARQPLQLLLVAAPVPQWWEAEAAAETRRQALGPNGALSSWRLRATGAPGRGSGGGEPSQGLGRLWAGGSGSAREGWLFKWTNYIKGYQRRWFMLSNGLLSYYWSKAEMGHSCRGTINLATASITVEGSCNFIISNWSGLTYHLKASSEVERQRWMTALEMAKVKAVRMLAESDESGDEESGDEESVSQTDKTELQNTLRTLSSKVEDLSTCNDLIAKHGTALQRSLSELESLLTAESNEKIKQVNQRATIFRITTNAMINACRDVLMFAQTHSKKWQKSLQYEQDQRIRLDETLEKLAKQHNDLERAFREGTVLPAHPSGSAGPGEDWCCSGNRPTEQ